MKGGNSKGAQAPGGIDGIGKFTAKPVRYRKANVPVDNAKTRKPVTKND